MNRQIHKLKFSKLKVDIPKYNIEIPELNPPKLETPNLLFLQTQSKIPSYENTIFAKMANDIKASYEKQLTEISTTLNEQLAIAKAETESAKKEALVSKIIAIVSLLVSITIGVIQIFL